MLISDELKRGKEEEKKKKERWEKKKKDRSLPD